MVIACLVCSRPKTETNMGMDVCRACTAFYKRNLEITHTLMCESENRCSMDLEKNIFSCRKCRMDRFEAVVRAANLEKNMLLPSSSSTIAFFRNNNKPIEFERMMHNLIESSHGQKGKSIIETIRANHALLCDFRRSADLKMRGIEMDPVEARKEKYELIPTSYRYMNESAKVLVSGLFDFAQCVFPELEDLPYSDKWLLIRNYHRCFHLIDSTLRMTRRKGSNFLFGSYTTYLSLDCIGGFFKDCPDLSNIITATRTLLTIFLEYVPAMKKQIVKIKPSEDEYLALIGLLFWSVENLDLNDDILLLATRYRAEILSDLTTRYRGKIGEEKGAARIGQLMCLLQDLRRAEMALKSDTQLFRMLGTFDDDTVIYNLQV